MMVSNCPRCQIVRGVKLSSLHGRCQIVLFCMMVSNCPRCQIVLGVKLSSLHGRCQIVLGVKLSSVSNCPITAILTLEQNSLERIFLYILKKSSQEDFALKSKLRPAKFFVTPPSVIFFSRNKGQL